ncbi:hypothetical protein EVAR_27435_1 [Eumeta japonica]|uniref:Uncharacterized protein n=1 Tax=Eumeta variegata TaxID=151549 RepID=A0A4C1VLA3_EUMVA|nr:hypothetical protein EVAR_27435_1 [Eumeta japonica]
MGIGSVENKSKENVMPRIIAITMIRANADATIPSFPKTGKQYKNNTKGLKVGNFRIYSTSFPPRLRGRVDIECVPSSFVWKDRSVTPNLVPALSSGSASELFRQTLSKHRSIIRSTGHQNYLAKSFRDKLPEDATCNKNHGRNYKHAKTIKMDLENQRQEIRDTGKILQSRWSPLPIDIRDFGGGISDNRNRISERGRSRSAFMARRGVDGGKLWDDERGVDHRNSHSMNEMQQRKLLLYACSQ